MTYSAKEVFLTVQGEGGQAGGLLRILGDLAHQGVHLGRPDAGFARLLELMLQQIEHDDAPAIAPRAGCGHRHHC